MTQITSYSEKYNLHEEKDPQAWKFYKQQVAQRWDPDEVCLAEDKNVFDKLSPRYKKLVQDLVAFFAPGDGLVCEQVDHLKAESMDFAQRAFLGEQYSIEVVHARAYKDIILTLFDKETQDKVFESVDTLPCVREKADYVVKYMNDKSLPLSLRYVAAAVSEGVFFVSLFAAIFYLREKKILNRFCFLNEQVAKDEKLHRDFDIMMARRGKELKEFTREQAMEIVQYGIDVEIAHIKYILSEPIDSIEVDALGGMTIENMERFIRTLGDQIMTGIGFERCFTFSKEEKDSARAAADTRILEFSPPWMSGLSMMKKTNFYENPVGNYTMISQKTMVGVTRSSAFEDLDSLGI
jgi:ribonucleotide reductase beta subunit family protein with ferritin-like domain